MVYGPPRFLFRRYEIIKIVKRLDSKNSFVEVGGGSLVLARELLEKHFNRGLIIENSTQTLKIFNKLKLEITSKAQLEIGDFMKAKMRKKFDVFIACEVMEHIKNDRLFLKKARSVLKPGGHILISVPAKMKYWSTDDELAGHFRRYEKKGLHSLLKATGFTNIVIKSYGFPFTNILRPLRIIWAGSLQDKIRDDPKEERTRKSGFYWNPSGLRIINLLVNSYAFWPFCLFSSLFSNLNLSEGYLILARKT